MAEFLKFPTFGGKQGIRGVTPIQVPQVRTSFPTARRTTRRSPEPTTKEKLGGLAPLVLRGLAGLIKKDTPPMPVDKYAESIGADLDDLSREEEALINAYTAYGPQQKVGGFKLMDVADVVAASQMGRGAPAYVQSALSLRGAENKNKAAINAQRNQFIKESLKPDKYNYVNLIDKEAAALGLYSVISGRENDRTGALQIQEVATDKKGEYTYKNAGPNYIKQTGTQNIVVPEDPAVKALKDVFDPINEKELAIVSFNNVVGSTLETLEGIGEDELTPNTLTSALVGTIDRATIEFDNASKLIGREVDGQKRLFGNIDDFGAGKSGNIGREGTGIVAEKLYNATQVLLRDPTNEAAIRMQEEALKELETTSKDNYGYTLREQMDSTVYNDVRLRSQFLQLGYTAAALNGQTGRTLSDKDLAYHLEIVGLGQTTNPRVLAKNLKAYMAQSIQGLDDEINLAIQQVYPQFYGDIKNNPIIQSYINPYYNIPKDENNVYLYPENIGTLEFKKLPQRRPGFGFESYFNVDYGNTNETETGDTTYDDIFKEEFGGG